MKQPTRFARMVEQQVRRDVRIDSVDAQSAVALLTREHRAVIRLVKGIETDVRKVKKIVGDDNIHAEGMLDGVQCVLAVLTARTR